MTTHIWYHKDCADGFTAAWLAWRHMDGAKDFSFRACQYGDLNDDDDPRSHALEEEDFLFLLDFHLPCRILEELDKRVAILEVFDHHKSFLNEVCELGDTIKILRDRSFHIDMNKCGARLFLDWLLSEEGQEWCKIRPAVRSEVDLLVNYVEDRDLWKHELHKTKEIQSYIKSTPYLFLRWTQLSDVINYWFDTAVNVGRGILDHDAKQMEMLMRNSSTLSLLSYTIPVINSPVLQSELGHELLGKFPSAPFSAVYWVGEASLLPVKFSLRSEDNRVDVSEIAKRMGGGGHRNAAGFHCSLSTVFALLGVG